MTDQNERRSRERCDMCQGPTKLDPERGVICRNSLCKSHHSQVSCPRCKEKDLQSIEYNQNVYHYTCANCLHKFKQNP